jgi:hypothetical protein
MDPAAMVYYIQAIVPMCDSQDENVVEGAIGAMQKVRPLIASFEFTFAGDPVVSFAVCVERPHANDMHSDAQVCEDSAHVLVNEPVFIQLLYHVIPAFIRVCAALNHESFFLP